MTIYYKCSFRSSHGYKIGKYDIDSKTLTYIPEQDSNISSTMPMAIFYALQNRLSYGVFLATDENGAPFLGVFEQIADDYSKYVNAVFYDIENPSRILKLFQCIISDWTWALDNIKASVVRVDGKPVDLQSLEYQIDAERIDILLRQSEFCQVWISGPYTPNSALALITEGDFSDHRVAVEEHFQTSRMKLVDHIGDRHAEIMELTPANSKTMFGRRIVIVILIVIIIAILALLCSIIPNYPAKYPAVENRQEISAYIQNLVISGMDFSQVLLVY